MHTSGKSVSERLRDRLVAGSLVVCVQEADETLAIAQVMRACKELKPVRIMSATEPDFIPTLEQHAKGAGTLITLDALSVYPDNAIIARYVREIALQSREKPSRLIMIDQPGAAIHKLASGDVDILPSVLPDVDALKAELAIFAKAQEIVGTLDADTLARSVAGLARHEAARLYARCWVELKRLDATWLRAEKARLVTERLHGALSFEDVDGPDLGGADVLRNWLAGRKQFFGNAASIAAGLPSPRGFLLVGPPGTGKSITPKYVARSWGLPLLRLDVGKLFGSLVGQSEASVRAALENATACAPCVLWIDEIDKALGGVNGAGGDGGTTLRVFGTILTWMQERKADVLVVATANNVVAQDGTPLLRPELLRRFDATWLVDLPTAKERAEILAIHLARRNRSLAPEALASIASGCDGYSGAELEKALIEAMFTAFNAGRDLKPEDLTEALSVTVPVSRQMGDEIAATQRWAKGRARPVSSGQQVPECEGSEDEVMPHRGRKVE